jgi:hypothetical protein
MKFMKFILQSVEGVSFPVALKSACGTEVSTLGCCCSGLPDDGLAYGSDEWLQRRSMFLNPRFLKWPPAILNYMALATRSAERARELCAKYRLRMAVILALGARIPPAFVARLKERRIAWFATADNGCGRERRLRP